jgi:hypothetical protein
MNGTNEGLHAFIVEIRDRTLKAKPGVLVGGDFFLFVQND